MIMHLGTEFSSGTSNMKRTWEDIRVLRARKLDIGIANSKQRGVKVRKTKAKNGRFKGKEVASKMFGYFC